MRIGLTVDCCLCRCLCRWLCLCMGKSVDALMSLSLLFYFRVCEFDMIKTVPLALFAQTKLTDD